MPADPSNTAAAPSWLDAALIQKALRSAGGVDENTRVEEIAISRALAPGENFSSAIYRVHVKLAEGAGTRSLIVKDLPDGTSLARTIIETGAFKTEMEMLGKHMPKMKFLLDAACPGRFPPFAARCLLYGCTPTPFLVLEDLKPQGFCMADRLRGLGLRHSLLAIRTLARFHAASAALLKENPSIANEFSNPFRHSSLNPYMISVFQQSADACRTMPGYEKYAEVLDELKTTAHEKIILLNDPRSDKLNVLLQGDYWTNNMMFRYDENGLLNDFRMVDLQLTHASSPTIDLLYFLFTSLSDEVSERHEDLLIREYHTAFEETLDIFGILGPSFSELMTEINEHGIYGVFGAVSVWPIARAEKVPDINATFAGDSSNCNFMYESPRMKKWLQRMMPEFERRGWLDI